MSGARAALAAMAGLSAAVALAACGTGSDATVTQTVTQPPARTAPTTTATGTSDQTGAGAGTEGTPGGASTDAGIAGATGTQTSTSIYRPFAATSPWNTTIQGLAADTNSDRYITQAQERIGVIERGNTVTTERRRIDDPLFINTTRWTVPIVDEENGVQTKMICRQIPPDCGDGKNVETLLVPPNASPLPQYDGWFTILNRREGVGYDLWRARRGTGNVISYQFMRRWSLSGPGFQTPNSVSARGSGLPLFAGVLLPEEIRAARIEHALAISVPGPAQTNYVQPASATDGNGRLTSIPEGARIRLRSDRYADLMDLPTCRGRLRDAEGNFRSACIAPRTNRAAARAILTALRRYGAIVVDRSRTPTLYAKLNADWSAPLRSTDGRYLEPNGRTPLPKAQQDRDSATPLLRGNEVQFLRLSDFEVLSLGTVYKFPPPGDTPVSNQTFTAVVP
jgi:hypothetical protein